jgi:acyl carrier protein
MRAVESIETLSIEIKKLIIDALALEDVDVADIATDAPLFGAGLELDSIDALELAIALEDRYGVTIGEDLEKNESLFASVASLAAFVAETRTR